MNFEASLLLSSLSFLRNSVFSRSTCSCRLTVNLKALLSHPIRVKIPKVNQAPNNIITHPTHKLYVAKTANPAMLRIEPTI